MSGGWPDAVFRRILDIFVTIPFLVLVIAIVAVLGPGLRNMYIAVSAVNWIIYREADAGRGDGARRGATTRPPAASSASARCGSSSGT